MQTIFTILNCVLLCYAEFPPYVFQKHFYIETDQSTVLSIVIKAKSSIVLYNVPVPFLCLACIFTSKRFIIKSVSEKNTTYLDYYSFTSCVYI